MVAFFDQLDCFVLRFVFGHLSINQRFQCRTLSRKCCKAIDSLQSKQLTVLIYEQIDLFSKDFLILSDISNLWDHSILGHVQHLTLTTSQQPMTKIRLDKLVTLTNLTSLHLSSINCFTFGHQPLISIHNLYLEDELPTSLLVNLFPNLSTLKCNRLCFDTSKALHKIDRLAVRKHCDEISNVLILFPNLIDFTFRPFTVDQTLQILISSRSNVSIHILIEDPIENVCDHLQFIYWNRSAFKKLPLSLHFITDPIEYTLAKADYSTSENDTLKNLLPISDWIQKISPLISNIRLNQWSLFPSEDKWTENLTAFLKLFQDGVITDNRLEQLNVTLKNENKTLVCHLNKPKMVCLLDDFQQPTNFKWFENVQNLSLMMLPTMTMSDLNRLSKWLPNVCFLNVYCGRRQQLKVDFVFGFKRLVCMTAQQLIVHCEDMCKMLCGLPNLTQMHFFQCLVKGNEKEFLKVSIKKAKSKPKLKFHFILDVVWRAILGDKKQSFTNFTMKRNKSESEDVHEKVNWPENLNITRTEATVGESFWTVPNK